MIWSNFILVLLSSSLLWLLALILYKKEFLKRLFIILGTACIGAFIIFLWVSLERPPLRTLGETRLWYAFFLPAIGMITYLRWRFNWMLFTAWAYPYCFWSLITCILKTFRKHSCQHYRVLGLFLM